MPPLQTILFDLGETLFEPLPAAYGERNLITVARQAGVIANEQELIEMFARVKKQTTERFAMKTFYLHREFIQSAFLDCCQALQCDATLAYADAYATAQRDAVVEHLRPRDDCFATLRELRERGYRLGIVSNIDNDWLDPLVDRWGLADRVDGILSSESANSCKPDGRIFTAACELLECEPATTLFVGDDEVNDVFGANRAGMRSVLFQRNVESAPTSDANFTIHGLAALLSLL